MKTKLGLGFLLPLAAAEFRRFEGPVNAASNYIHYSEGYVVTPGYVDISNLVFSNADGNDSGGGTKIFPGKQREWVDDDEMGGDEIGGEGEGDDSLNRRLDGEVDLDRQDGGGDKYASGSTVSIRNAINILLCIFCGGYCSINMILSAFFSYLFYITVR